MEILRYNSAVKTEWDTFVKQSRNRTFLFFREFMEYHSDRFIDHSLMFYSNKQLVAILPGNIANNIFYSHQGLTYGGLILSNKITCNDVLSIFSLAIDYLKSEKIKQVIYKSIPHIYHTYPSEEEQYALFRNHFVLMNSSIASVIQLENRLPFAQLRKRKIKLAEKNQITIKETNDLESFWEILEENLSLRHHTKPVHSISEIILLQQKFPEHIRLFCAYNGNEMIGGSLIFETEHVAHVQYISANESGKHIGALDKLFDHLLSNVFENKKYFDFGTSTEQGGWFLNEGLIAQKEGFGARGIVYNTYSLTIE